jgi:sulfur carrier protein
MDLRVNGHPRQVPTDVTIDALLTALDVSLDGIAVAINRTVVPRGDHRKITLQPGDEVEIIQAVGGG